MSLDLTQFEGHGKEELAKYRGPELLEEVRRLRMFLAYLSHKVEHGNISDAEIVEQINEILKGE